jgi:undecaprenyl-diphosphatase
MGSFQKVIILAIVQGLTEFLPVSSSGHLVLGRRYLGLSTPGTILEVGLHFGTLLAILIYYRNSIFSLISRSLRGDRETIRYAVAILVSMLPAIIAYSLWNDGIESTFANAVLAGFMLCVTGVSLLSSRFIRPGDKVRISLVPAFIIGAAQAFAMLPGISRSGFTIMAARFLGIRRHDAAQFSFLMAVPVLAGAAVLNVNEVLNGETGDLTGISLLTGVLVSAAVGYAAIAILLKALAKGSFWLFGLYCIGIGSTAVILELL